MLITKRIFHHFFTFLHAIMNLDPSFIIHVIIMITSRRNSCRIKIRIRTNGCSCHKTSPGVTINTNFLPVNKRITISQLLYHVLIVSQRIIPLIAIPESMIIFASHGRTSPVSHGDNNKTKLCQSGIQLVIDGKTCRDILEKWSGIHAGNNRIQFCRIKIRRFPHHPVQIGNPISSFHRKTLRSPPSHLVQAIQIRVLQRHDNFPFPISNNVFRFHIHP